jgi:hypothetical protein
VRFILSLLVGGLLVTSVNATPSEIAPLTKASIADQIRHPQGQQLVQQRLQKQNALTDAQIAALVVQDSRSTYYATGHPCACPDDHMRNGRNCGGTSAYVRPGGAHPLCYATDVSPEMIRQYRISH